MGLAIFLKQSIRSLKKNWSVVTLIFLFLIVGVSLIVGLSAYLFNAHLLVVDAAFKSGSQDGMVNVESIAWDNQSEHSSSDREVIFTPATKTNFKKVVGKPKSVTDDEDDEFYSFLLNKNGFTQSFMYERNDFLNQSDQAEVEDFQQWINSFKWFNGNALAFYFKKTIKPDINVDWDVRTTDIIGDASYYMPNDGTLRTYFTDETDVTFSTFDERQIDFDYGKTIPTDETPIDQTLFNLGDFSYNLKMSYEEYQAIENPIFLIPKNFRDFNIKVGDVLDISNSLLPANGKNEKFTVVGEFTNSGKLFSFSSTVHGAIPFSHLWETIQSKNNYLEFPFSITMNQNNSNNFLSRPQEIQNQIEKKHLFEARAGPGGLLPEFITVGELYVPVVQFWQVNLPIVLLCIIGACILIFFVILFTTKQLIENNKSTLQFLKSMGMNNFELSSINMTLILIPMFLGFLVAIPVFFVVQNIFSFILETQYPMVLNFWMWNFQTIFIFLGIVVFAVIVFFLTNFTVLKKHNILEKTESKLAKRVKSGRFRNYIYNHVEKSTKIGFAISGANLRKNLVTFALLLVTFSVILFGVGFKGSIHHQAQVVENSMLPYKNFSYHAGPLFANQEESQLTQLNYSQEAITEKELIDRADELEITPDILNDQDKLKGILTNGLKDHYITSTTIDEVLGADFEAFLEYLKEVIPDLVPEALRLIENLYENYQVYKLQLEKLYQYDGEFKFIFGRSVNPVVSSGEDGQLPIKVGRTLNLDVRINQRINNKVPPKKIRSIGLIDQSVKNILDLNSTSSRTLEVKISQALATKLDIYKTELSFKKPTFRFQMALANDNDETISIPVRVVEILRADFTQNAIYYSFDNLRNYLSAHIPYTMLNDQLKELINPNNLDKISNAYYTNEAIPNALLNMTLPIVHGNGTNILQYLPEQSSEGSELVVLDFKLIAQGLITQTASYINLINRVILLFIVITIIVSLLLTYLFLVENKQNILLFKSLGYSMKEITKFLVFGYAIAAIIAAGLSIGASVLIISLLSNVFVELFNAIIPFAFTPFYTGLFILLPIIFVILILVSLWIYIFKQDPKKALNAE